MTFGGIFVKKTIMLFLLTLCAAAMFSFHSSALDAETDEYKDSGAVPAGAVYGESRRDALQTANALVENGTAPDSLTYFANGARYRTVNDGYYTIGADGTDLCFNVSSDGADSDYEGISITVWEKTDDVTQRFRLVMNDDGTYTIFAACSRGGYDRAVGYDAETDNVGLYSLGSDKVLSFYIKDASDGEAKYIVPANDETKCLAFDADAVNGSTVFLSGIESAPAARWIFNIWGSTDGAGVERAMYPGDMLLVTQAPFEEYSHGTQNATDVQVTPGSSFFAPFSCKVTAINEASGNVVWVQSLSKVLYADGSYDYMTVLYMHDDDISDIYIGEILLQGQYFYEMGTAGYADGAHVHISCFRGEYSPSMKISNLEENAVNIWDAFYLPEDIPIKDDYGFAWVYAQGDAS